MTPQLMQLLMKFPGPWQDVGKPYVITAHGEQLDLGAIPSHSVLVDAVNYIHELQQMLREQGEQSVIRDKQIEALVLAKDQAGARGVTMMEQMAVLAGSSHPNDVLLRKLTMRLLAKVIAEGMLADHQERNTIPMTEPQEQPDAKAD